ncbi:MAG: recombinase family protein [Chloroflexi bacterium]|nr:recombinase family protein [Chloroflexota bacterium]
MTQRKPYYGEERDGEKPRAVGYIRVSGQDQIDGWSLDGQIREIEVFCQGRGLNLTNIYRDPGHSAFREKVEFRPGFNSMMADAERGKFDVIVCVCVDRMARDLYAMLGTLKSLSEWDVSYMSIKEDLDFRGSMGKLILSILSILAEQFSESIPIHTRRGQRQRRESGMAIGIPPYAYQLCDERCLDGTRKHPYRHVSQEKAEVVQEFFNRYEAGQSLQRIADWANAKGYKTNGGRADRRGVTPQGGRFTAMAVGDILGNRFYCGYLHFDGRNVEGVHEPIISVSQYERVQEIRTKNAHRHGAKTLGRRALYGHLLAKVARCFECGLPFHAVIQGADRNQTYYRMDPRSTGTVCRFTKSSRVGRHFDDAIMQLLENFRLRDDWKEWILNEFIQSADINQSERRKEELEERKRRTTRAYRMHGALSDAEYDAEMTRIDAEIASLIVPEFDDMIRAGELLENIPDVLLDAGVQEQNDLIMLMFDAVYLDFDTRTVHSIQPKSIYAGLFRAMVERSDLQLQEVPQFPFCREVNETSPLILC